ncbi:MAG: methylated-DNA--[protein]-cysteine S-methyltransferase [Calditrichaceae bacterium]|jgi:methylated-DNA-[protein]-cysteine S-methyltransferase
MDYITSIYNSAIGPLKISVSDNGLHALSFCKDSEKEPVNRRHPLINDIEKQLDEYFTGKLKLFNIPLCPEGSNFQKQVWREISKIPFGSTTTYLHLAEAINNPKAVRAVGMANGKNPVPIIIPCHRVIGSNGKLTGYGGGIWRKEWLLRHEGINLL